MFFSKRLIELRKQRGWTQQDLANKLKISRSTVANYEADRKIPREETLIAIANLFNVSIDYLLGRTDDPTGYPTHLEDLPPMERLARFIKENDFKDLYFNRSGDYFDDLTSEEVDELIMSLLEVKRDVIRRKREKENQKE
ncbi:helix-turn-helix domain-containing protein [Melghirimyces algeriensis]|uniref:DNA-binding transcriptional regulator, XRE-family HTH domain n=1 Tax=Melghirimyces algeriensis TaxID=910412 RepID=A0A521C4I3_9BACL|nr:helix-turn-helix domain-containing protein [Melghirimyces algeriensis]SMO54303.1 DNA-binding transcriptional regulator, XRE-family HTH domain [Melghirimyces algeriensis]